MWHVGDEDMVTSLERGFDQLKNIREQIIPTVEKHLYNDLNEEVYQNSDTIEDPSHEPPTKNIEYWTYFHD